MMRFFHTSSFSSAFLVAILAKIRVNFWDLSIRNILPQVRLLIFVIYSRISHIFSTLFVLFFNHSDDFYTNFCTFFAFEYYLCFHFHSILPQFWLLIFEIYDQMWSIFFLLLYSNDLYTLVNHSSQDFH